MKALRELVSLISRHKRKQVEVLGYNEDGASRYELFYGLIEAGRLDSDDDAARYFFGPDKDSRFTQYRNLHNNLLRRLVNTFFFIDLKKPEFNDAQQAAHHVRKYAAAARMLASRGARHSSIQLAKKAIRPAIKYELAYEAIDLARLLRHNYAFVEPDKKKRGYYEELLARTLSDLELITKAESMYYDLISPYITSRASKPWVSEKAKAYLAELTPLLEQCAAHQFHLFYHIIAELECASRHDQEGVIRVCQEAIAFLEKRPATTPPMLAAFYQSMIAALTVLRRFEEAEEATARSENLTQPGTHNWFKGLEQAIVLHLHRQQYQKALETFRKAKKHRHFSHLSAAYQESWHVLEAYMHLLRALGKITVSEKSKRQFTLRPAKFLNNIPTFSRDKRGLNIPVLVIHALSLLHLNRYDEAYDRMLALDKYASRHLKEGEDTFRSYCFIKALLQIPKTGFRRDAAQDAAWPILSRMSTEPLQLVNTPHEIEAIPYEHLWEMAMEALEG